MPGSNRAGVNRVVWNLGEMSACAEVEGPPAAGAGQRGAGPGGRGGGGGRGGRGGAGGGTWLRAIPGVYTVRLIAGGETREQPLEVRQDPRVDASPEDMRAWHREASTIERTECTIDAAAARVRSLDRQLAELERSSADASLRTEAGAVRRELRPVVLGFVGDVRDPGHVNLSGRINWLTIQVGNYSGRPTAAQSEWIATYAARTEDYVRRLEGVVSGSLARLNGRLRSAGLPEVR